MISRQLLANCWNVLTQADVGRPQVLVRKTNASDAKSEAFVGVVFALGRELLVRNVIGSSFERRQQRADRPELARVVVCLDRHAAQGADGRSGRLVAHAIDEHADLITAAGQRELAG